MNNNYKFNRYENILPKLLLVGLLFFFFFFFRLVVVLCFFFFFSSRRRHTRFSRDWSSDVCSSDLDYQAVKDLHTKAGLIDACDAAVIERRAGGKVKITKKHETPTRAGGGLGAGAGLATGLVVALFPFAAIGGGLLAVTTGGGAVLGALAGHAAAGMSRKDLKELGEHLDAGQAGLVVVAVSDMETKIERAMKQARKVEARQLKADTAGIEADAKSAQA